MNTAWRISTDEKLSTLYDASYLAVAETVAKQSTRYVSSGLDPQVPGIFSFNLDFAGGLSIYL